MLEKHVEIEIRTDGVLVETTRLRVKLESDRDSDVWSPYAIALDENRELASLDAAVETPGGKKERLGRRELDTLSASPDWVTHGSARVRTVRFPRSPAGSILHLDYTTKTRPYFPSSAVWLGERDRVERLSVQVKAVRGLRWAISGSQEGLQPVAAAEPNTAGALSVTGVVPRPDAPDLAPSAADEGPVLRFAWGDAADWAAVGAWYEALVRDLPQGSEAVRRQARTLAPESLSPRAKLEALLAFARADVRYVAVEVGVGGYRASAPEETLTRRWGDCKAKAVLLTELLRAVGLDGYPALIHSDERGRAEVAIPNPGVFNHMIVAVPAAGIAQAGDPVADGLLFVDPTHPRATVAWLHPGVQDQDAFVAVGGNASRLVRTPTIAAGERERLELDAVLTPDGAASGQISLTLQGDLGAVFSQLLTGGDPERLERAVRAKLEELLAATTLEGLTAREEPGRAVPQVILAARFATSSFATLGESGVALSLPGSSRMPAASLLDGRTLPVVTAAGVTERVFRITLPLAWSPPSPESGGESNALGSFAQTIAIAAPATTTTGPRILIERRSELLQRWLEPEAFADLRALSLAESRAARRRLRLSYLP